MAPRSVGVSLFLSAFLSSTVISILLSLYLSFLCLLRSVLFLLVLLWRISPSVCSDSVGCGNDSLQSREVLLRRLMFIARHPPRWYLAFDHLIYLYIHSRSSTVRPGVWSPDLSVYSFQILHCETWRLTTWEFCVFIPLDPPRWYLALDHLSVLYIHSIRSSTVRPGVWSPERSVYSSY